MKAFTQNQQDAAYNVLAGHYDGATLVELKSKAHQLLLDDVELESWRVRERAEQHAVWQILRRVRRARTQLNALFALRAAARAIFRVSNDHPNQKED